ncbi:hormogonium polysaccharide biosynthesis protein HpsJ [Phormidesmis priestleyi]
MKATNSPSSAPIVLKIVGVILILSSLVDYISLLIPFRLSDKAWLAGAVTQLVDRGIIPMVGLAFLFIAYFLETGAFASDRVKPFLSLRFWSLVLASILGLMFLVLVPLHLNNTRQASEQAIQQINQEATAAEGQVDTQVLQRQEQLSNLLKDEAQLKRLNDTIASGQVQGDQLKQLQEVQKQLTQLKANPGALEGQAKEARNKALIQIRDRKQQLEQQARTESWKTGLRVGVSSLLLSLGYSTIAWTGFRELGIFRSRRKAPAPR